MGPALRELLEDPQHSLCFSVASLWELVIKAST
jgi:PIN domain nuclease of toxin-antitoxin system